VREDDDIPQGENGKEASHEQVYGLPALTAQQRGRGDGDF
jgi:hypothetical protein